MKRLPTDLQILDAIYEKYYKTFVDYSRENRDRSAKNYVPIDIKQIAASLKVDGDIVFGRLYYHLEKKYGYTQDNGAHVHFFALEAGEDRHCINFPVAASVLADLKDQARKHNRATRIAVASLILAFGSLIIAIVSIVISILGQQGTGAAPPGGG